MKKYLQVFLYVADLDNKASNTLGSLEKGMPIPQKRMAIPPWWDSRSR
jgi:hypothetical protein